MMWKKAALEWWVARIALLGFIIHLMLACSEVDRKDEVNRRSYAKPLPESVDTVDNSPGDKSDPEISTQEPESEPGPATEPAVTDITELSLEGLINDLGWDFSAIGGTLQEVRHEYLVGRYNCTQEYPVVIGHLLEDRGSVPTVERYDGDFITDESLNNDKCKAPTHNDYTGSGYDRGHLAPAHDFAKYGEAAMKQSFLTSNIAPQVGEGFNRDLWLSLETATRYWLHSRDRLLIMTGVVVSPTSGLQKIGYHNLSVPDYFFKIIVDVSGPASKVGAIAFLMRNVDHSKVDYGPKKDNVTNIERHQVTIDKIEEMTGINFFSNLPAEKQAALEGQVPVMWEH
ncbi:MAG: DNA/RNA non-specific endonuclease [Oligoflexales bacterium]